MKKSLQYVMLSFMINNNTIKWTVIFVSRSSVKSILDHLNLISFLEMMDRDISVYPRGWQLRYRVSHKMLFVF